VNGSFVLHLAIVLCGIGAVAWGLPAAHRLKPPLDTAAALVVLAGVLLALLGTLLTAVPGFFSRQIP
jgi:hypothetical protein